MSVIGLDPGPTESALVVWNGVSITDAFHQPNEFIIKRLDDYGALKDRLVIEQIASYGMAVGEDVFETVYWSGRFAERFGVDRVWRMKRLEVKMHLCHDSRAKDKNIRQAIIDRFGGKAATKKGGSLYGVAGDMWAALAVALTHWDLTHVNQ